MGPQVGERRVGLVAPVPGEPEPRQRRGLALEPVLRIALRRGALGDRDRARHDRVLGRGERRGRGHAAGEHARGGAGLEVHHPAHDDRRHEADGGDRERQHEVLVAVPEHHADDLRPRLEADHVHEDQRGRHPGAR